MGQDVVTAAVVQRPPVLLDRDETIKIVVDAVSEVARHAGKEAGAADGVAAGEQLGIGEPRVVVDRDVQVLPANPPVALRPAGLAAEHPLARLPEAAQLLCVDVQQLARALPFVTARTASLGSTRPR